MSTIKEQIESVLHAVEVFRVLQKNPKEIEALLDAVEILKRVQGISDYINPQN